LDFVPWSEQNPAASAGLHNKGKRLLIIFDEASEIPQIIFDVAEGVLLDENTEIIWLIFGNPTRNNGPFYDAVFGEQRHRWKSLSSTRARSKAPTNSSCKSGLDDYGEDSDFFRVRARGLPPRAASGQYIDQDLITKAQTIPARSLPDDPLVAGVDFAWGGDDDNVIASAKDWTPAHPPIKVKGEFTRDPAVMTRKSPAS
jgi:hypothetical protein